MPQLPGALDYAIYLADNLGFNVLPAARGKKPPIVDWTRWQTRSTREMLPQWFDNSRASNFWIFAGAISGLAILDCENRDTIRWWDQQLEALGVQLANVHQVRSRPGHYHFYFQLPPGLINGFPTWKVHGRAAQLRDGTAVTLSFDLQCNLAGVIAAGSQHETGGVYEWVGRRGAPGAREELVLAPTILTSAAAAGLAVAGTTRTDRSGQPRSILTKLLLSPPGEGERNDWLTKVCGHYAKEYRTRRDAYEYHVAEAAIKLNPPLSLKEIETTRESVWNREQTAPSGPDDEAPDWDPVDETVDHHSPIRVVQADAESGYLLSGANGIIFCQTRAGSQKEGWTYALEPWTNFDLVAKGASDDPDDANLRVYDVVLIRALDQKRISRVLYAKDLADNKALAQWLAQSGVNILPPDHIYPKTGTQSVRLQRYLEAQKPPTFVIVGCLGHHTDHGFICHEGRITVNGLELPGQVRPAPRLRGWAKFRYGWLPGAEGVATTRAALREILTFHYPLEAAVIGSWWAASLVKPLLERYLSLFPFLGIEAPAGHAKTKGIIPSLVEASGLISEDDGGQSTFTAAAFRDAVSAHNSGLVWMDDQDALEQFSEYLRSATGGGKHLKKGEDRTAQVEAALVSPILITGEQLGLSDQKALRDRSILLAPRSPVDRLSLVQPIGDDGMPRLQWDDVLLFRDHWPDLNNIAGNVIQLALQAAQRVITTEQISLLRRGLASGRVGDKGAVLRVGARILADMVQDESWIGLLDDWVISQPDEADDNTAMLKLIPRALALGDYPDKPEPAMQGRPATPVYMVWIEVVDPDADGTLEGVGPPATKLIPQVCVSTFNLAAWWEKDQHGRVDKRTETFGAIGSQLNASGATKITCRVGNQRVQYWRLTRAQSLAVYERARGVR